MQTLSFDEWLVFSGADYLLPELMQIRGQKEYISSIHREITDKFNEYLVFGGYPEIALEKDKDERILLLKELKNAFLKKDIEEGTTDMRGKYEETMEYIGKASPVSIPG